MPNMKLLTDDFLQDPALPVRVLKREPELPYRLHSHEFTEIAVIYSGTGTHFTSKTEFSLSAGQVIVIPPGIEHGYKDVNELCLYNIIFDTGLIDNLLDINKMPGYQALFRLEPAYRETLKSTDLSLHLSPSELADVLHLIERLREETVNDDPIDGAKAMGLSYFMRLIVKLCRIYSETPRADTRKIIRLAEAISFIETHLDQNITSEDLTEVAMMSTSSLNRYFKETMGLAPLEYHMHKRIERACSLLRNSDLSITQVAAAVGFSDPNYFSRQFKKIMGRTPSAYLRA